MMGYVYPFDPTQYKHSGWRYHNRTIMVLNFILNSSKEQTIVVRPVIVPWTHSLHTQNINSEYDNKYRAVQLRGQVSKLWSSGLDGALVRSNNNNDIERMYVIHSFGRWW